MKTIVHLSDLHFGREDRIVVNALQRAISALAPSIVVVSGDLTQRARRRQFLRARQFLDGLPFPKLVVPGNHDVPLFNVLARWLDPLGGYKRYVTTDLAPSYFDPPVVVVGLDTTRPSSVKAARIHSHDVERICDYVQSLDAGVVKILAAHHPFDEEGREALEAFTHGGVDVFLTGHLHVSSTDHTANRHNLAGRSALVVEAGTATSTRLRETTNAFNVLHVDPQLIAVERYDWQRGGGFVVADRQQFDRIESGWAQRA